MKLIIKIRKKIMLTLNKIENKNLFFFFFYLLIRQLVLCNARRK